MSMYFNKPIQAIPQISATAKRFNQVRKHQNRITQMGKQKRRLPANLYQNKRKFISPLHNVNQQIKRSVKKI